MVHSGSNVNTLLTFLKEVTSETFIGQYKGKKAAVDTSCWLHKALTISVQRTGQSERYVLGTEYRLFHQLNHLEHFLTLFVCTVGFLIVRLIFLIAIFNMTTVILAFVLDIWNFVFTLV